MPVCLHVWIFRHPHMHVYIYIFFFSDVCENRGRYQCLKDTTGGFCMWVDEQGTCQDTSRRIWWLPCSFTAPSTQWFLQGSCGSIYYVIVCSVKTQLLGGGSTGLWKNITCVQLSFCRDVDERFSCWIVRFIATFMHWPNLVAVIGCLELQYIIFKELSKIWLAEHLQTQRTIREKRKWNPASWCFCNLPVLCPCTFYTFFFFTPSQDL